MTDELFDLADRVAIATGSGCSLIGIGVSNPIFIDQTHPGEHKTLHVTRRYLDDLDAASPTVPRDRRGARGAGAEDARFARAAQTLMTTLPRA